MATIWEFDGYMQSLVIAHDTVAVLSVIVVVYSLFMMRRGLLRHFTEDYSGVLMAGYAGKIPQKFNKSVPRRLAAIAINGPGIIIPIIMFTLTMEYPNTFLLMSFMGYYIAKLFLGLYINGFGINICEVLMEYTLNIVFAYCQSASLCYLEDYRERSLAGRYFHLLGTIVYGIGLSLYVFHEYKLKCMELAFKTKYTYIEGGLFNYTASPQYFGELLIVVGLFCSTGTVIAAAQLVFVLCYLMVLANIRRYEIRAKYGDEFNSNIKRLIPFVW